MTIQPYEQPTQTIVYGEVDSWVPVLASVGDLAGKIAGTDFVPESLRGKPAAVAAAILTGRELGIGPMTALQNIHIVKGKPGQSAQLMRALVLAAGHSIQTVEANDTRCIVRGRRKGEEEWEEVRFTADQARKAKIDLGAYPEDKLVARATSRLCRRKFADCLAGMPYLVDELEDLDGSPEAPTSTGEAPARRTAQRKVKATTTATASGVTQASPQEAKAAPVDRVPEPPLPGEDEPAPVEPPLDEDAGRDPVTKPQLAKMHAAFNDLGVTDREERLKVTRALVDAPELSSANELTKDQASTLIDVLEDVAKGGGEVTDLYAAAGLLEDPS